MLEVDETFRKLKGAIKTYFDPVQTSEKSQGCQQLMI